MAEVRRKVSIFFAASFDMDYKIQTSCSCYKSEIINSMIYLSKLYHNHYFRKTFRDICYYSYACESRKKVGKTRVGCNCNGKMIEHAQNSFPSQREVGLSPKKTKTLKLESKTKPENQKCYVCWTLLLLLLRWLPYASSVWHDPPSGLFVDRSSTLYYPAQVMIDLYKRFTSPPSRPETKIWQSQCRQAGWTLEELRRQTGWWTMKELRHVTEGLTFVSWHLSWNTPDKEADDYHEVVASFILWRIWVVLHPGFASLATLLVVDGELSLPYPLQVQDDILLLHWGLHLFPRSPPPPEFLLVVTEWTPSILCGAFLCKSDAIFQFTHAPPLLRGKVPLSSLPYCAHKLDEVPNRNDTGFGRTPVFSNLGTANVERLFHNRF